MTNTIHQEISYPGGPAKVYDTLINAQSFAEFTGAPAEIDATDGGAFSCFGGLIVGRNIELVPGARIVQAWRVSDWEEGVYSIVRFSFKVVGSETRLTLDHTGYPEEVGEHLVTGWPKMYWEPLRAYLAAAG